MPYRIGKHFTFSGAHHLPDLPEGHKCKRPHGHNWTVVFDFQSEELNEFGFVIDYGDLDVIKTWIDDHLDHRDLNEVLGGRLNPTTAEHLAHFLYEQFRSIFPELVAVVVAETEKTYAEYRFERGLR